MPIEEEEDGKLEFELAAKRSPCATKDFKPLASWGWQANCSALKTDEFVEKFEFMNNPVGQGIEGWFVVSSMKSQFMSMSPFMLLLLLIQLLLLVLGWVMMLLLVEIELKPLEKFTILLKFDVSISPSPFTKLASHGDSTNWDKDGGLDGNLFPVELFWKTLQTTHSSCWISIKGTLNNLTSYIS